MSLPSFHTGAPFDVEVAEATYAPDDSSLNAAIT